MAKTINPLNPLAPIGIFDSGLGGLSVLATLMRVLPNEHFIYYGDSLRAPYGTKDKETVKEFSHDIVAQLVERGVKAVVIACNTATSAAASSLREAYDLPIVGMEPALKPAALAHPGGNIAVLATEMTLKEQKFARLMRNFAGDVNLRKLPVPEFVTLVEEGLVSGPKIQGVLERLFPKEGDQRVDGIVLGCTHFVFLRQAISDYFGYPVNVYDGNLGTARQVERILKERGALHPEAAARPQDRPQPPVTMLNSKGDEMIARSYKLLSLL